MKKIKVKAPAKINLTLEVLNRREDGFHDIRSVMQTINLYDYLSIETEASDGGFQIELSGNNKKLPYDEHNLIYKAVMKYFEKIGATDVFFRCYLEKNIPIEAGLAGGSTDAAAALFALNKVYDNKLSDAEIAQLCSELGSDVNFCYKGGCAICTSRGEKIRPIPFVESPVSLIKPIDLKISAKEAYTEYDLLERKEYRNYTEELVHLIVRGGFDINLLHNDLELPLCKKYHYVNNMKKYIKNSLMSGSGPVFYVLKKKFDMVIEPLDFWYAENLRTTGKGVEEVL